MVGLGLTAPMAAQMLAAAGVAQAQPKVGVQADQARAAAGRSRRCGGRAPTLLNPHFAVGTKDQDGSRIFYEPLAVLGPGRQPRPGPRRRDPERAERRRRQGRQVGDVEAQEGRGRGTTASPSPPTTASSLGVRGRPRHGVDQYRHLQGHQGREGRQPHHPARPSRADAVLGGRLLRRAAAWSSRSTCSRPSRAASRARRRTT